MAGPLDGISVVEFAGIGPAPFCGMVLADLGTEVTRIDRPPHPGSLGFPSPNFDLHNRGKKSIGLDLKSSDAVEVARDLVAGSDVLLEGFRPGTMEKLGLGPADALALNTSLVYTRLTGWGQDGPLAPRAGHDIDYLAISGVLHAIGEEDRPTVPLNLIADFGGGGMLAAVGVLAALLEVRSSGRGQVVDAAMVDGASLLSTSLHGFLADGFWADKRSSNLLDGGAPFYSVYETADRRHMAVGALEPQFFAELISVLGIEDECPPQHDPARWSEMRDLFSDRFRASTMDEWTDRFEGKDACVAPVLSLVEAQSDPHLARRGTFRDVNGVIQPAPAPRFSKTPSEIQAPPPWPGQQSAEVLEALGYSRDRIGKLTGDGAVFFSTEEP